MKLVDAPTLATNKGRTLFTISNERCADYGAWLRISTSAFTSNDYIGKSPGQVYLSSSIFLTLSHEELDNLISYLQNFREELTRAQQADNINQEK